MKVTRKLNLPLATVYDRIRQLTHSADVSCFQMCSETGGTSDHQGGVRVSLQNPGIGLYELNHALLGIETAHKKDGLALANFLPGKEQFSIDTIEYDFGF